jgi:hypothetical protein
VDRTSLVLGSAYGNLQETATFLDRLFTRGIGNALLFPNMVFNAPLSYGSIELGIRGETAMLSMLEVSGEAAIGSGVDAVASGRADVCIAGGVDELGHVLHRVLEDGGGRRGRATAARSRRRAPWRRGSTRPRQLDDAQARGARVQCGSRRRPASVAPVPGGCAAAPPIGSPTWRGRRRFRAPAAAA